MSASSISINPLTFSQRKLFLDGSNQPNVKEFAKLLSDLGQWANQMQQTLTSPALLASNLNSNGKLQASSLAPIQFSFASVTTNQSVACAGGVGVFGIISFNAAVSLALNNVALGVPVVVRATNNTAGALNFTMTATTPSNVAYAVQGFRNNVVSDLTVGISVPASAHFCFVGASTSALGGGIELTY